MLCAALGELADSVIRSPEGRPCGHYYTRTIRRQEGMLILHYSYNLPVLFYLKMTAAYKGQNTDQFDARLSSFSLSIPAPKRIPSLTP